MLGGTSLPLISFSKRQTLYPFEKDMNQAINSEEELASMKAPLERLSKDSTENDAKSSIKMNESLT